MDLGPTVLRAAGLDVPTYLEGRPLQPYWEGKDDDFAPREWVFCEDNYQIMMRGERHKLVYYIGQEAGELYDLQRDPHELYNLWDRPECGTLRAELKDRLLSWLATSTYYNAGYRRARSRHYKMRWPREEDPYLHGGPSRPIDRPVDL